MKKTTIERAGALYETSESNNDNQALAYAYSIRNSITTPAMREKLKNYKVVYKSYNNKEDMLADRRQYKKEGYLTKTKTTRFTDLAQGTLYQITATKRL